MDQANAEQEKPMRIQVPTSGLLEQNSLPFELLEQNMLLPSPAPVLLEQNILPLYF
jgi:hypothetical protein